MFNGGSNDKRCIFDGIQETFEVDYFLTNFFSLYFNNI